MLHKKLEIYRRHTENERQRQCPREYSRRHTKNNSESIQDVPQCSHRVVRLQFSLDNMLVRLRRLHHGLGHEQQLPNAGNTSQVDRKIRQKLLLKLIGYTYVIVIHWQRHTQTLFIIFAAATSAAAAAAAAAVGVVVADAGAADDDIFVVVAIIFIGCVCRRQNGVCMSTINVIHIECTTI